MRIIRLLLISAVLALGLGTVPVYADTCTARTDVPNYSNNTQVPQICDEHGSLKVQIVGDDGNSTGMGTATSAAPTRTEGTITTFSFDLAGNARVTLGTTISGEDQTNNLLMTSGGAVRSTTMASAVTTDTTSTAVALPTGSKSIYASLTGTGAITQTIKIYGGITSGVTTTTGILLCTLTMNGTTAVYDACPVITANYLFYIVNTSSTSGTSASSTTTAMY